MRGLRMGTPWAVEARTVLRGNTDRGSTRRHDVRTRATPSSRSTGLEASPCAQNGAKTLVGSFPTWVRAHRGLRWTGSTWTARTVRQIADGPLGATRPATNETLFGWSGAASASVSAKSPSGRVCPTNRFTADCVSMASPWRRPWPDCCTDSANGSSVSAPSRRRIRSRARSKVLIAAASP